MTENLKNAVEQVSVQKKQIAGDSKKANGRAIGQGDEKTTECKRPKKMKFWCEMCQIVTYSQAVMETHKNGKKHRAQLQNLVQKDEVVVNKIAKASSDHTQDHLHYILILVEMVYDEEALVILQRYRFSLQI